MSRYLMPAKIGLLAVIELYTEELSGEAVLPILSFVTSHLIDLDSATSSSDPQTPWRSVKRDLSLVESIKDFEQLLTPYQVVNGLPGRRLWDVFLSKIWTIDSLDALHGFFEHRTALLVKTKEEQKRMAEAGIQPQTDRILLSRNSPFGTFVRRSQLEFNRLRFSDASSLWIDFVKYRQPTAQAWQRRNPAAGPLSFDAVLLAGQHEWGAATAALVSTTYGDLLTSTSDVSASVSTDYLDNLLEFQIAQMQKYGQRVPKEIHQQFSTLLQSSRAAPTMSHYLSFLEAWRSGDYPLSFDYLHRYFDYTMHNKDRLFYHYALLNLAVLQADFGCHKDAVSAIRETIAIARERQDMSCLNFALNWFYNFSLQHPNFVEGLESNSMSGTGKETLEYLRVKAKESGMWSTWSSAFLNEAKMGLSSGDSIATALESVVRSSQILVENNMTAMFGSQVMLNIALWDRAGVAPLSTIMCKVFIHCHAPNANMDDRLKITCRLAALLAVKGKYDDAMALLESLDKDMLRTSKVNKYWQKYRGLVKIRRDMHRNDLDSAAGLLSQLLQAKPDDLEMDMVFVVDSLQIEILMRRNDLQAAFAKVEELIAATKDQDKDVAMRVRLLLWKATLYDKAGRPQRGFTIAMRAASIAWRARLMALLWQSIGGVATILVALEEFDAAAKLMIAVIPRCLECEGSYMIATLYSILADANMGLAGKMDGKSNRRMEYMTRANDAITQGFTYYSSVEDLEKQCEMMAKQAMIMRVAGDQELADDSAAKYLELRAASVKVR